MPKDTSLLLSVTHVALAFVSSEVLLGRTNLPITWPLFEDVASIRAKFPNPNTKILVAIGGWGDDKGFPLAAETDASRELFARNVAKMIVDTGADGVDIDWEYPGGNGENYKRVSNESKQWEIDAFPLLLYTLRCALGWDAILSVAVPGKPCDMIAFTPETTPRICEVVDFVNVMTYDLMNRRNNVTTHHASVAGSRVSIEAYLTRGFPAHKMNLGFAFYVRWFNTEPTAPLDSEPVRIKTPPMEDPATGEDLGQAGAIVWSHVPAEMGQELSQALEKGTYDEQEGGHYYWDRLNNRWWTWETPESIRNKFDDVVTAFGLGGVFAWALGEDAPLFKHLEAVSRAVRKVKS